MKRLALIAAAAALVLAGCGAESDDLFLVKRTGALPDARVDIVVNDGGTVACDRGAQRQLDSKLLLRGRDIVRALDDDRLLGTVHPPRPGSQLRFELRTGAGDVTFDDLDAADEPELGRMVQLVRELSRSVCGKAR